LRPALALFDFPLCLAIVPVATVTNEHRVKSDQTYANDDKNERNVRHTRLFMLEAGRGRRTLKSGDP
jgi:hypothetical protein